MARRLSTPSGQNAPGSGVEAIRRLGPLKVRMGKTHIYPETEIEKQPNGHDRGKSTSYFRYAQGLYQEQEDKYATARSNDCRSRHVTLDNFEAI